MATDPLTCDDVFMRLDDFLDRELSASELEAVRVHLERCVECAAEFAFEGRVLAGLRAKLRRVRAPAHLYDTIVTKLNKETHDERS